ncbi:HEAT repeat domain-containing protein [Spirochaeta africana]|uniref:HEAT repeat-containing protein n=1 Tax=Spirochaeta africana (strain ATCC 700263 / DSM 8902 / Z-7692) TaxID=889378 RepID=H9UHY3_SPIAZ|nr:HEAT repeat domain-containing protein [Spirochaeta africana]AFG37126.1 HEAT repeat-containing protein [Spirochaeta africana DSM 8902]
MNIISELLASGWPVHLGAALLLLALLILTTVVLIRQRRFIRRLQRMHRHPEIKQELIQRTQKRPSLHRVHLLLRYAPDDGLFAVFLAALRSRRCARRFRDWLQQHEDVLSVRKIALSGKGESFDGAGAVRFFHDRLDQIRELAGHPEWSVRYMSCKILLHDTDERSRRALREMFHDPHSLIRRTMAEEFAPIDESERDYLLSQLQRLLTDDYVHEVRTAARQRLHASFKAYQTPDLGELSQVQILHVLEQLVPGVPEDHDLALQQLGARNIEIQLQAARFAQQAGVLSRLLRDADPSDSTAMARTTKLLQHAAESGEVRFLYALRERQELSPASLEIAASILNKRGPVQLIPALLSQAIKLDPESSALNARVYREACRAAARRGDAEAAAVLRRSLFDTARKPAQAALILAELTGQHAQQLVPPLLKLLKDPEYPLRSELEQTLARFDHTEYLPQLLDIVASDRQNQPHIVRISAFQVIGQLQLPSTLQSILEHLPVLPLQQAREFADHLARHDSKEFSRRVLDILSGEDGKVRAALIAAVPATGNKDFIKPIRSALTDADPLVRSAAAWALMEYGDTRSLKDARALLRDPVMRVRSEAAHALGQYGNDSLLKELGEVARDPQEAVAVQHAAIQGLKHSSSPAAVPVLAAILQQDTDDQLLHAAGDALAAKTSPKELEELIIALKDADPQLRSRLTEAFGRMGEAGEESLIELLQEDIASLRPYITEVLEKTGCIDATVRRLSHRDPEVRRTAAQQLSIIGTAAAFRGIVVAARDPDTEVRVMVTKALERLAGPEGKEILAELEKDPDRRIRKYTLWALERIKAGEL